MKYRSAISLPPTKLDTAISHAIASRATPRTERELALLSWLADERILLGLTAACWALIRIGRAQAETKRQADSMLCSVALAGALPHLGKRFVNRTRPNRRDYRGAGRGIPKQGEASDSFPSGHAMHLGAMVVPLTRLAPRAIRPLVWPSLIGLACTRIALLAHYPSDVAAGFGLGLLLQRTVRSVLVRCGAGRLRKHQPKEEPPKKAGNAA